ncbi:MAG: hypothetical protein M3Q56_13365 [Bacteroidota bacterium]|nr:hypothetical protein [Bacteroidota bacterium]
MNYQRSYSFSSGRSLTERLLGSVILLLFIVFIFYISFQLYKFLFYLAPIFLIIALVLEPNVVWDHLKKIALSFKKNILGGLVNVLIQLFGFPLVTIGLAFKAWAYRKFGKIQREVYKEDTKDIYTSYEIVDNDSKSQNKIESQNNLHKSKRQDAYDDLFE